MAKKIEEGLEELSAKMSKELHRIGLQRSELYREGVISAEQTYLTGFQDGVAATFKEFNKIVKKLSGEKKK